METEQKEVETNQKVNENEQFLTDFAEMVNQELDTIEHKKRVKGLRGKKKLMINALIQRFGIVSDACNMVGIGRTTHYDWLRDDPRYKEATKEAQEVLKDLGEKALIGLMAEKNPQAIIHFNKTKNRDRGYGDYVVTEEVGRSNKLTVEIISNENSNNQSLPDERGSSSEQ